MLLGGGYKSPGKNGRNNDHQGYPAAKRRIGGNASAQINHAFHRQTLSLGWVGGNPPGKATVTLILIMMKRNKTSQI